MSDLPAPERAQHENHRDQQEGEQEQADYRAVGDVPRQYADLESERSEDLRVVDRATFGQEVDYAQVGEGEHSAEDQRDHHDRRDDGQDDLVIPPPEARAVDGCGVEHVLRHRSEPGYEDHHPEREQPPGMHDGYGDHREVLLAEPLRRMFGAYQPDRDQRPVDHAVERIEHPLPGERGQRHRHRPRQHHERAGEVAAGELLHQQHGGELAEQQADDLGADGEYEG